MIPEVQSAPSAAGKSELPRSVLAAAALVGCEALALLAAALFMFAETAFSNPHSVRNAVIEAGFALVGALILAWGARGLLRLRPWARTPVVVLQLLALPVGYTLAFEAHRLEIGAPILIAALATLYLLFTPAARAALDR